MAQKTITEEVKQEVYKIIKEFNNENFDDYVEDLFYFAEFKGKYLFLKRRDFGMTSPIAKMKYTGNMKKWEFAIFKWSREDYDPDEWFFPGVQHVDGTLEGAMKAGMLAYPV